MPVKTMQELIEFYEMVDLNDAALSGRERLALFEARRALRLFEKAMETLRANSSALSYPTEADFFLAA
jgi:hypothetical protein